MTRKEPSGWLAQLDGIRGISILMVLTQHVHAPGWARWQGRYGVRVFFVLSGFLITRLLLREEHEAGRISLSSFYIRRTFRLFPIYYIVLAVYCILILGFGVHADGREGFAGALPYYITYTQEIPFFRESSNNPIAMPFGHSWSLGIEEKFYLVWPVLAFWALRNQNARIGLAATAFLFFSMARFVSHGQFIYPYAAISCGCLVALMAERAGVKNRFDYWVSSWRAPVAFLAWPFLHAAVAYEPLPLAVRLVAELAYPFSIAFVILASLGSGWLGRVFSLTPLVVLGRYSYCIYLIHLMVRQAVERVLLKMGIGVGNGLLVFVLMVLLSMAGASVLYYAIESPFREMGRAIARSRSRKSRLPIDTHAAVSDAAGTTD